MPDVDRVQSEAERVAAIVGIQRGKSGKEGVRRAIGARRFGANGLIQAESGLTRVGFQPKLGIGLWPGSIPSRIRSRVGIGQRPLGTKIGTYTDSTGTYDLYDIDGDGQADFAKKQGTTNDWYYIESIELIPVSPRPGPMSQQSQQFGTQSVIIGFETVYHFSPVSTLSSAFDFSGETTSSLMDDFGWTSPSATDPMVLDAYQDGELFTGQVMEMYWVVATRIELPQFDDLNIEVSIEPMLESDNTFTVYGLAMKGNATDLTAAASQMGLEEISFTFGVLNIVTTIDSVNNQAVATAEGVIFDTYSF